MTMSNSDLRAAVERLRQEIDAMDDLDPASRQRLQAVLDAMGAGDEGSAEAAAPDRHVDTVREAIEEFEVSHPRTTAILNDILVTLSNMGI
jgi:hypothetical protein